MISKTFCSYPFDTIFVGPDSGIKTCCSSSENLGILGKENINDILQGDRAKSIRQSILRGEWHPQCHQCKTLEDMGGRSERSEIPINIIHRYQSIKLDRDYFKLRKVDLRWSNICNLACNYCYEYFSSQWSNIKGIKVNDLREDNQESLFLLIEKFKDDISEINLLGGEPLLQKQNLKLLEILSNKDGYLLTNLAVPLKSNKIARRLLNEPKINWGISFETIGKRFEYVRHNAKWEQFTDNLKFVREQSKEIIVNAHPLYCVYSAFNLVEYYNFVLSSNFFNSIYWCTIQNIEGLNVFNLSKKLKEKSIIEIEKCEKIYSGGPGIDHLIEIKNKLIENIDNKSIVEKNFLEFNRETEKLLPNKQHKFQDLWPDIYQDIIEYP